MDRQQFLDAIDHLSIWRKGDQRAPHKPLLLLFALAEFRRGHTTISFEANEESLSKLLQEFGPPRKSYHPEFPFWYLRTDGLWTLPGAESLSPRKNKNNPPASELRAKHAIGQFPEPIQSLLKAQPGLIPVAVQRLLDAHFPESMHQDILDQVGLSLEPTPAVSKEKLQRDPAFRNKVMLAYSYRCAICGLDARLDGLTFGIEAAHIKWHQAHGPDIESNGLGLCSLHHKIFDRGGLTVDAAYRVLVSARVTGNERLEELLFRFHGGTIHLPFHHDHRPNRDFLAWHAKEVFQPGHRYLDAG